MKESTSKEKVLKKVRNALINKLENPFKNIEFSSSVFYPQKEGPEVEFATKLVESGGTFIYCSNENDVGNQLSTLIENESLTNVFCADNNLSGLLNNSNIIFSSDYKDFNSINVGITPCDFLISRFGSIMVSSGLGSGRRLFVYPEIHIVIAKASQVVPELKDAIIGMKKKYSNNFPSQITTITGPSRTADIEKTLVMGAHGPKSLYVFMIDDM
ncbi:MAG: LUD domain-containing protein [Bacteroidetes bacterium]|nr:LUD domain-containing protein [Bacteroidota bacterium]